MKKTKLKSDENKRAILINFNVSSEEKQEILSRVKGTGLDMSSWIRYQLFSDKALENNEKFEKLTSIIATKKSKQIQDILNGLRNSKLKKENKEK